MRLKNLIVLIILMQCTSVNAKTCGEMYKSYVLAIQRAGNLEQVKPYWSKLRRLSWEKYLVSMDKSEKREIFEKQYFIKLREHAKKAELHNLPKCISIRDSFKVRVDMRNTDRKEAIIGEVMWEIDKFVVNSDVFYRR